MSESHGPSQKVFPLPGLTGEQSDNNDSHIFILDTEKNIIAKIPLMDEKGIIIHDSKLPFHERLLAVDIIVEPNTIFSK